MSNFTDQLWSDLVREHGPRLAQADRPAPRRGRGVSVPRRPRVLAGSTLGLAGVGTAVLLAVSAASSSPAFAITKNADGVLLTLNQNSALPQANAKLASMGIHEAIEISMAAGAATVSGPVTCTPEPGVSGPTVKVLDGADGTEVIPAGNTGAGTWHLGSCSVLNAGDPGSGNSGNTGATGNGSTRPMPGTVVLQPAKPAATG